MNLLMKVIILVAFLCVISSSKIVSKQKHAAKHKALKQHILSKKEKVHHKESHHFESSHLQHLETNDRFDPSAYPEVFNFDEWDSYPSTLPVGTVVDPFNYGQRMSVYKSIISQTGGIFGSTTQYDEKNPIWGLPIQLAWQKRSGRQNDMKFINIKIKNCKIDDTPTLGYNGFYFVIKSSGVSRVTDSVDSDKPDFVSVMFPLTTDNSFQFQLHYVPNAFEDAIGLSKYVSPVAALLADEEHKWGDPATVYPSSISSDGQSVTVSLTVKDGNDIVATAEVEFTQYIALKDQTLHPNDWWSGMNYYLSIIPYLGGMKAGLLTELKFKSPYSNSFKYCVSIDNCKLQWYNYFQAVENWSLYFKQIKQYKEQGLTSLTYDQLDELKALDWAAHTASIKTSSILFSVESGMLPDLEMKVSLGWGRFVEYIAAVRFDASFENIANLQPLLAQRILSNSDKLPFLEGLTPKQTVAAGVFVALYTINQCSGCGSSITEAWVQGMQTDEDRKLGREIMTQTFDHPEKFPGLMINVVKRVVKNNSYFDLGKLVAKCAYCASDIFSGLINELK